MGFAGGTEFLTWWSESNWDTNVLIDRYEEVKKRLDIDLNYDKD